jgi:predicted nuclease of predicted toxin-antitoxin system
MSLSLLCDEHIPYQAVEGLRRRGIDVITVQRVGLRSALDEVILDAARQQSRVVYTNDPDFLRLHATGIQHSGILYHHILDYSIGEAIG